MEKHSHIFSHILTVLVFNTLLEEVCLSVAHTSEAVDEPMLRLKTNTFGLLVFNFEAEAGYAV